MRVNLEGRTHTTPFPKARHMITNTKNAGMGKILPWHQDGWPLTADTKERFPASYSAPAVHVKMSCLKIGLQMRALDQGFLISLYQVLEISSDMILSRLIHHTSQIDTLMRVHRFIAVLTFIYKILVCIGFWYRLSNDRYCINLMAPVYTSVANCIPYALYFCSSYPILCSVMFYICFI